MIDEEKTYSEKGYHSADLSKGSHKEVWRVCDGCGDGMWIQFCQHCDMCHLCAIKVRRAPKLQKCETPTKKRECIDDEITFVEKGYRSTDLKPGSSKPVWRVCAGCGEGSWIRFCAYRDLCQECAKKKQRKHDCSDLECMIRSIDEEKTYAEKGYYSTDLSAKSHKEVWAVCTECGDGRWVMFRDYRDLCFRCSNKGKNHPNWQGGKSYEPYCEKFNDAFKEAVRDRFDRKCFGCDKTEEENGMKLCVHHVSYDKECICNGVDCEFVPLCIKCHAKTNFDRELWERLIINTLSYEGWI